MIRFTATAILSCLFFFFAAGAHAQENELQGVLERIAEHWERGDASEIAALGAERGVRIMISEEPAGPFKGHRMAAVLHRLFERWETVSLETGMARVVGGSPARAFGEWVWRHRGRGATVAERTRIFLALVREESGWRITEIRLLGN